MAQCRKLKFTGGLDLVWIDFIQNVHRQGESSQYTMMSQIAKDLQAFQQLYDERLTSLPNVQRLVSTLVMKSVIHDRVLPL